MTDQQIQAIRERLQKRSFNPTLIPGKENILFKIQGENIGSLSNFVTFSGLPKSGKSTFISGLIASNILHHECLGMELHTMPERPEIAYFDTESSPHDFYRTTERIKKFALRDDLPQRLFLFCTREDTPGYNILMIEQFMKDHPACSVLFIDGLLDLIVNYNDERESRKLIQWLKKITAKYQCLLVTVLHTSKSGEQRLGHLGAGVDRYSQSVLEITKDKEQYILKGKYLRSSIGFEDVAIQYDKTTETYQTMQGGFEPLNPNENLLPLFDNNKRYKYGELINAIRSATGRGENYAKVCIKDMKQRKQIDQDKNGNYFLLITF